MSKKLDKFMEDCTSVKDLEIYHFFTKEQIEIIEKLEQKVENRKYSIYEFDIIEDAILNYLKSPDKLSDKGITQEEYNQLINTFKEICKKYKL